MPVPLIDTLIEGRDGSELVRDQIAAILLRESESQQQLAIAQGKDPLPWMLRVYLERSNPWADWIDLPETTEMPAKAHPIVNVWLDNITYDPAASNVVERQKATGLFQIDCYGYGVAADDTIGHVAGDESAAIEAQRVLRLCRQILMAATYTYLGLRGLVWRRFPQSASFFQPQIDGRSVQQVQAARLTLAVDFNEFSPQVHGPSLEELVATVRRKETGEIYFVAQWGESA